MPLHKIPLPRRVADRLAVVSELESDPRNHRRDAKYMGFSDCTQARRRENDVKLPVHDSMKSCSQKASNWAKFQGQMDTSNLPFSVWVSAFVYVAFLAGCSKKIEEPAIKYRAEIIEVKVNEAGSDLKKRYPDIVRVKNQPIGINFYKIDWEEKRKGVISVEKGKYSFVIDDVLAFSGSENIALKNEGMSEINMIVGLSGENGISHQQAREKFFKLLSGLRSHEWQSVIPHSAPRLRGKDMLGYLLEDVHPTALDADYEPSLGEWMKLEDLTTWELYADGTFLNISFIRDREKLDLSKPGSYILNINFQSDVNYFKGFVPATRRTQWRELLPDEINKALARRMLLERESRAKGFRIDETYRDPPFPR